MTTSLFAQVLRCLRLPAARLVLFLATFKCIVVRQEYAQHTLQFFSWVSTIFFFFSFFFSSFYTNFLCAANASSPVFCVVFSSSFFRLFSLLLGSVHANCLCVYRNVFSLALYTYTQQQKNKILHAQNSSHRKSTNTHTRALRS